MTENAKRRITLEDLYRFEIITSAQISPDGQKVIYAVQQVNADNEKKFSNLWLAPAAGGKPRRFTSGKNKDGSPKWSPDGSQIAFISKRSSDETESPQIFLIPADGGEAQPLTRLQGEIRDFAWSPDGSQILLQFRKKDEEVLERERDPKKKELGIVARHIDRVYFKLDGEGYLPKERFHIWVVDAHDGSARQLTDSAVYDESDLSWSPDGKQVAFVSNRTPDPDFDSDRQDLFVLDVETGEQRLIPTPAGPKGFTAFSPDGKWIAYIGKEGLDQSWKNDRLWLVPADGSAAAHCLTADVDINLCGYTINDIGGAPGQAPIWAPDSQSLIFQVTRLGANTLYTICVDGSGLRAVFGDQAAVGHISQDAAGRFAACLKGTMTDPGQIWLVDLSGQQAPRCLTRLNAWLDEVNLSKVEEVWFKGSSGNDLQGWIMTPPDFDPAKKYPSILEIHGGPLTQYGWFFMHEFYFLASLDYVVYFSNPRGGQGYGEEHARAIYDGKWGTVDYEDLMCFADLMAGKPYIDTENMGVTGGSYGGYMTNWIIGHTSRFKAAVTQRSVSNLISMWGSSDFNWSFQKIFGNKAPYEDLEILWRCSPMKYIANAKTPTLVIHNLNDQRCDPEQGIQVFVALKKLGVETGLVLFPDEPHGLSRMGRTDRRITRLKAISGWFEKYLK
ncbi:MAG TPA: S9 family peptidase [Anaerolineaceae bacterium]|nr:S9 family peptidase [Anaerolineaceae bacterium]HPN50543.1 S9 family peptidase [Anaerolineaceae bacterium]